MESATNIAAIAAGGALGSVARYLVNTSPAASAFERFPFPTFLINIVGSFLIGFLLILLTDRFNPSEAFRLAVIVGFLGAFTTFSTFEMEIYTLAKGGDSILALGYALASLLVGFIGLVLGVWFARLF